MKLSFVVQVPEKGDELGEKSFIQQLRLLSDLGYDGVVLAIRDASAIDRNKVKELTNKLGLEIVAISTGAAYVKDGLSLSHPSVEIRNQAISRMAYHIWLAEQWGKPKVIIGLIRGRLKDGGKEEDFISAVSRISRFADSFGIEILIEAINRYETDFIHTLEDVKELIEESGWSNVRILADMFHMNIEERSITEALKDRASLIGHVDVADSNRRSPGQGHIPFPSILQTLKGIGYDGHLCVELIPVLPDFETAARQSIKYLRAILKRI